MVTSPDAVIVILMGMVVAVIMTVIMFMIMSMRVPMRGQGVIVRHDRSVEQARARLNCCAGGILWPRRASHADFLIARLCRAGQEKGAARIGEYGQAFRRTHDAKDPGPSGCVAAGPRGVAALDRISDTLFARLLADHLATTQRS